MSNLLNFIFGKKKKSSRKLSLSTVDISKIQDSWAQTAGLIKVGNPSQLRQAIIKADNLLDFALKRVTTGTTMGERLKNAQPFFRDYAVYQALWEAHKVRNALVHDADYDPPHFVIKEAIGKFKLGFEVLGVRLL